MNETAGTFCTTCGATSAQTRFCTSCGAPRDGQQQTASHSPTAPGVPGTPGAKLGISATAALRGSVTTIEGLSQEEIAAGLLFKGMSHEPGRNADVFLYQDRIERVKQRSRMALSKASQEMEVTPIRAIASVQTRKDGFHTKVIVHATGNPIEFRFRHEHARLFKDQIQALVLNFGQPAPTAATTDIPEQLMKLAQLRDSGIITQEEFAAKKAELLARL
jgi:hypothetical protein